MTHRADQRSLALRPLALGLLVAAAALGGIAFRPIPAHAANGDKGPLVYRWVDEKGIVHYGDRIPPQYAQQDTTVLNRQGVVVDHVEAPKTPAELAQAARIQAQQIAQKQRDNFLLTTY